MPGGSAYPGPSEVLKLYIAVVDRSASEASVKGAKNPYTSFHGHIACWLVRQEPRLDKHADTKPTKR